MNRIKVFIILCMLTSMNFAGQKGSIRGIVMDQDEKLALPGANIILKGLNQGTTSDYSGHFVITNVESGTHELTISYIGYEPFSQNIDVLPNQTTEIKIELIASLIKGSETLVMGEALKGQAKALNTQKSNSNITNIVAADQIGKFPDSNIGDALKRIPGINMAYDQGEARFGMIRGTESRLNSVMINGERVPSAEAEIRTVQLDLIPADMVQTIEVNKALTPEMDADAIGGAVNIVTRSAPNTRRISATLGSGYNFLSEKPMLNLAFVYGERFLDQKLGMVISGSHFDHHLGSDNIEPEWDYNDSNDNDKYDSGESVFLKEMQVRKYEIRRLRQSISAGFDYKLSLNHILKLKTMYNHRNDWENRYRITYKLGDAMNDGEPDGNGIVRIDPDDDDSEISVRRETKGGTDDNDNRRLEDQRTFSSSLSGEHLFFNKLEIDWKASFQSASEERPYERYIEYRNKPDSVKVNLSDEKKPYVYSIDPNEKDLGEWKLKEITEEEQWTEEKNFKFKLDSEYPLMMGLNKSKIKVGLKYKHKTKERDDNFFEYEPTDDFEDNIKYLSDIDHKDYTDDDFLAGDYKIGDFAKEDFLGDLDLSDRSKYKQEDKPDEYAPGNYEATENIIAGYVSYEQYFGKKLLAIAGLRVEQTNFDFDGKELFVNDDEDILQIKETSGDSDYTNLLPGLHLKYELDPKSNIRFAWTNTIARPNYYDLVPYREVAIHDSELKEGNPDLDPTTSMNFDLMYERFFESVGLVSFGFFYKDIKDFIFEYTTKDYNDPVADQVFEEYSHPENGGDAKLMGFEIAAQRQLDFLPGMLKGVHLYGNYTFNDSEIDGLPIEGRENEKMDLPGTAKHTFNASASYETTRLTLRVSYNYSSDFVEADEVGDEKFFDRYYDETSYLDLNLSYAFTPRVRFYLEANNLTDQPLRYYQGKSGRTMQSEYYSRRISTGLKFDF